ncbi:MAG: thiamine phosphate synthase [Candidatus Latescibacterota bacterium]
MDVLAVSPESGYAEEGCILARLLEAGLCRYHLRKPRWSPARLTALLDEIPAVWRPRIVLHQHYELSESFGLGGLHLKDGADAQNLRRTWAPRWEDGQTMSRSLHRIDGLERDTRDWDYAFVSPVFPSITKSGYAPDWPEEDLAEALRCCGTDRRAKIYALGGICSDNLGRCADLGFDGVVLHGALWQDSDPVRALEHIMKGQA